MKKTNICSENISDQELLQHEILILQGVVESKARYRKLVQAAIGKWVEDFKKGNIEIKTVDDLRKLVEMDIELQKDEY